MFSSNLIKKKLENRLFDRTKDYILSSFENLCSVWDFGGIVLIKADNKKLACIAPDADWKDFVVQNFADLLIDKNAETPEPVKEEPQEEKVNETPRQRRRARR